MAEDVEHWDAEAADWITWARTPGHDAFWAYRAPFLAFVGPGAGRAAIDIGGGEGRVSRALAEAGWRPTLVEPVAALLAAARDARSAEAYHLAPAADLPVTRGTFDLAILYNVLMDVEDVPAAVAEAARTLAPSGRLVVGIVHPVADLLGEADADYFARRRFDGTETRDGLSMRFGGWSQPISAYAGALAAADLVITRIEEPRPDSTAGWSGAAEWARRPLFLWLEARAAER